MDQLSKDQIKLRRLRYLSKYVPMSLFWTAVIIKIGNVENILDVELFTAYRLGCMTGVCITCGIIQTIIDI